MSQSGYHEMCTHHRESVLLLSPRYQDVVQEKIRNSYVCFTALLFHGHLGRVEARSCVLNGGYA